MSILAFGRGEEMEPTEAVCEVIREAHTDNHAPNQSERKHPGPPIDFPVYMDGMSSWSNGKALIQEP
jgi:hypothetical protein